MGIKKEKVKCQNCEGYIVDHLICDGCGEEVESYSNMCDLCGKIGLNVKMRSLIGVR